MEANETMCSYLCSAQLKFDEACVAFADKHNMCHLADEIGIERNVMRNMLNPEQPRVLKVPVLFAISKATGDYSILSALLRDLDIAAAHIPINASESEQETFLKRVLKNSECAGDFSRMALEYAGSQALPRSTKNKIINQAQKGISNLVLLINDLENRTGSVQPFFAMGVDLIANGAALPGLS